MEQVIKLKLTVRVATVPLTFKNSNPLLNGTIGKNCVLNNVMIFIYYYYYLIDQHSGDAKNPYLAQYSDVCEDSPVSKS